jgi:ribonuclease P protein component
LPPLERVRKSKDFRTAQAQGQRVRTRHFVLVLSVSDRTDPASGPRLGIVASRRVGNAVVRNRAKRLVREAFRATRDLFNPRLDLIVIVIRPLHNLKLDDIATEWRENAPRIRRRAREMLTPTDEAQDARAID